MLSIEGTSTGVNKQYLPRAFSCASASDLVDCSYSPCVWAQIHSGGPPLRFASMYQPSSRNGSESTVRVKCGDVWAGENRACLSTEDTPSHLLLSACLWAPAPQSHKPSWNTLYPCPILKHLQLLNQTWLRVCNHFKETVLKGNTITALCWILKASVVYMKHVSLGVLCLQKMKIFSSV